MQGQEIALIIFAATLATGCSTRRQTIKSQPRHVEAASLDIQLHRSHVRARAFAANPHEGTRSKVGTQEWFTEATITLGDPIRILGEVGLHSGAYAGVILDPTQLVLQGDEGSSTQVSFTKIRRITLVQESRPVLGTLVGLLVGSVLSFALPGGKAAREDNQGPLWSHLAVGGGIGALLGLGYGTIIGLDGQFDVGPEVGWIRLRPQLDETK